MPGRRWLSKLGNNRFNFSCKIQNFGICTQHFKFLILKKIYILSNFMLLYLELVKRRLACDFALNWFLLIISPATSSRRKPLKLRHACLVCKFSPHICLRYCKYWIRDQLTENHHLRTILNINAFLVNAKAEVQWWIFHRFHTLRVRSLCVRNYFKVRLIQCFMLWGALLTLHFD